MLCHCDTTVFKLSTNGVLQNHVDIQLYHHTHKPIQNNKQLEYDLGKINKILDRRVTSYKASICF